MYVVLFVLLLLVCGFDGGCVVGCVRSRNSEEETAEDRRKKWQYLVGSC